MVPPNAAGRSYTTVTCQPATRALLQQLRDAGDFRSMDAMLSHFAKLAGAYPRMLSVGRRGQPVP